MLEFPINMEVLLKVILVSFKGIYIYIAEVYFSLLELLILIMDVNYINSRTIQWVYKSSHSSQFVSVAFLFGDSRLFSLQGFNWSDIDVSEVHVVAIRGAEIQELDSHIFRVLDGYEDSYITIK